MEGNLLNKNTSVVLYRQLADVLRQFFRESQMPVGARIPTEFELSAKYGVSRGTVRQALHLLEEDGLIERVPGLGTFLQASANASDMPGSERRIGLIIPPTPDQLSLNILIGVESVAKYRGYQLVFSHSNENLAEEKADIERMLRDHVSGLIIFPVSNTTYDEAIWKLQEDKFPFVLVDRYFADLDCDYVVADNLNGGFRATEHLILNGHTEIGFLFHPQADFRTTSVRDRYQGYRKALEEYHISFQDSWLVSIDEQPAGSPGEDSLLPYLDFLRQPSRPSAFFTVNDISAINLLAAAARLGISVPEELVVVGFDNIRISAQIQHPLTTINQERTELGVRAAHLLLGRIDGRVGKSEHIVVPTSLVIRESCGARQRIWKGRLEELGDSPASASS